MSQELKREYLRAIRERYQKSSRVRKSMILEEFVSVCGYSRKYAIRILNGRQDPTLHRCRGRITTYTAEIVYHLVRLWDAMGRPCSIRFKAAAPEWIEFDPDPILRENASYRGLVLGVSRAHLDRLLRPYRGVRKGPSLTREGLKSFRNRIPIEPKDWNVTAPGTVQSDTVAHCGDSLQGGFANTLTVTDIHTTWTETRGIWGKGAIRVIEAMREIENALPFAIANFKSDSGSEFMNHELQNYFSDRMESRRVKMTRSRPYKKDDNCYVEQKNFTHVRELFGYDRIGESDLVPLMNEIYAQYWCPLQNFFVPSMKLLRKTRIGAKIKKEYDIPKTPFQRLMECPEISEDRKEQLRKHKAQFNPFRLQEGLNKKLKAFQELLRQRNAGRLQVA